jgi:hypothetical protein
MTREVLLAIGIVLLLCGLAVGLAILVFFVLPEGVAWVVTVLLIVVNGYASRWAWGWMLERPLRTASRALRGATVQLHALRPAGQQIGTPRRSYELDVTIIPRAPAGTPPTWDLDLLDLEAPDAEEDALEACQVSDWRLVKEGTESAPPEETPCEVVGPQRLRVVVGVRPGIRRLVFAYGLVQFGEVILPAGQDRPGGEASG